VPVAKMSPAWRVIPADIVAIISVIENIIRDVRASWQDNPALSVGSSHSEDSTVYGFLHKKRWSTPWSICSKKNIGDMLI
jgi:hypothetical protein